MSSLPESSPRVPHPVSPSKPAWSLQLLQGGYYVAAGLLTAVFIQVWHADVGARPEMRYDWVVRALGVAVAGFGAYLAYSGYHRGRVAPAGAGMWVALALIAAEGGALLFGQLPNPFLIDMTLQVVFLVSWVAIMFRQVNKQIDRSTGPTAVMG
jgi:uncharacterized membrane protein YfcA